MTYVVGGTIIVQQGPLVITFANHRYGLLNVNYAPNMFVPGLIGMDIINSGILTMDIGTRVSFTM